MTQESVQIIKAASRDLLSPLDSDMQARGKQMLHISSMHAESIAVCWSMHLWD